MDSYIEVTSEVIRSNSHFIRLEDESSADNVITYEADSLFSEQRIISNFVSSSDGELKREFLNDQTQNVNQSRKNDNLDAQGTTTLIADGDRAIIRAELHIKSCPGNLFYEFDMDFIEGDFEKLTQNVNVVLVMCNGQEKKI